MRPCRFCWKNLRLFQSALAIREHRKLMAADCNHGLDLNCMHLPIRITMRWDYRSLEVNCLSPVVFRELVAAAFEDHLVQLVLVEICLGAKWHPKLPSPTSWHQENAMQHTESPGTSAPIRALLLGIRCAVGKVWLDIYICVPGVK